MMSALTSAMMGPCRPEWTPHGLRNAMSHSDAAPWPALLRKVQSLTGTAETIRSCSSLNSLLAASNGAFLDTGGFSVVKEVQLPLWRARCELHWFYTCSCNSPRRNCQRAHSPTCQQWRHDL